VRDKAPLVLVELLLSEEVLKELTTYRKVFMRVRFLCPNLSCGGKLIFNILHIRSADSPPNLLAIVLLQGIPLEFASVY
jgi:hypothetical protein